MNEHFKPILCRRCGTVVWEGISWAGFAKKLDTKTLTIEEELIAILKGLKTYECWRTKVSFEAVERDRLRIEGGRKPQVVILADHICSGLHLFATIDDAPDYWARPVSPKETSEGIPF